MGGRRLVMKQWILRTSTTTSSAAALTFSQQIYFREKQESSCADQFVFESLLTNYAVPALASFNLSVVESMLRKMENSIYLWRWQSIDAFAVRGACCRRKPSASESLQSVARIAPKTTRRPPWDRANLCCFREELEGNVGVTNICVTSQACNNTFIRDTCTSRIKCSFCWMKATCTLKSRFAEWIRVRKVYRQQTIVNRDLKQCLPHKQLFQTSKFLLVCFVRGDADGRLWACKRVKVWYGEITRKTKTRQTIYETNTVSWVHDARMKLNLNWTKQERG